MTGMVVGPAGDRGAARALLDKTRVVWMNGDVGRVRGAGLRAAPVSHLLGPLNHRPMF